MRQYNEGSGIKVLDRAVAIVSAVAAGDKSLAELSDATELPLFFFQAEDGIRDHA